MTPFRWSACHVAAIDLARSPAPAAFELGDLAPSFEDFDLWDHWPVQEEDGRTAEIAGGALVFGLTARKLPDPETRHHVARLRLFHRVGARWRDLGLAFPDGASPGSREWAGSAQIDPAHTRITLHFTAAGRSGETALGYEQRLFEAHAPLAIENGVPIVGTFSAPREMVQADGVQYETDLTGVIGAIKAFRDPFWFRHAGEERLLFAASKPGSRSSHNGLVGQAALRDGRWVALAPLVDAEGLNNELERPHLVRHGGRLYLFWSTQSKVFSPDGPRGPTGLYGIVAETLEGPWAPINGTGLVFANPPAAPFQAFSWQVLDDLSVWSFADYPGLAAPADNARIARAHFGGRPAPIVQIKLEAAEAFVV